MNKSRKCAGDVYRPGHDWRKGKPETMLNHIYFHNEIDAERAFQLMQYAYKAGRKDKSEQICDALGVD